MPELRQDPITGRWTIFAPDRAKRPQDFGTARTVRESSFCPFCPGNESSTPSELVALRDSGEPDQPGWRVRVIPNKFPALQGTGPLTPGSKGMFSQMPGLGAHEVVIESSEHTARLSRLSEEQMRELFEVYRSRFQSLKQNPQLVQPVLFKNQGSGAGASLEHIHSQLIVTPFIPTEIHQELAGSEHYFQKQNRCIYCNLIEEELAHGSRIVWDTRNFVALCPFASRFAFETWILPKSHASHFEDIPSALLNELGMVLRTLLGRQEVVLDDPPYNYALHTAPFTVSNLPHYHWHLEIIPRLTSIAGFEWGSGSYINPVLPEDAATHLRHAAAKVAEIEKKFPRTH